MGAREDFLSVIRETEPMQELLAAVEEEPVRLLNIICWEYEATGRPVPDHYLHPSGYVGEVALRALLAAGLVEVLPGERHAIRRYHPSAAGMDHYKRMREERGSPR